MSSKIKVDTIENVAGSGNVSLGSGHNLVVPGNITVTGASVLNGGIDVAGDFNFDIGGGDITFKDDGTSVVNFGLESGNFIINAPTSDTDIIFKGNDGGSAITALTLDMSAAGDATFNNNITTTGNLVAGAVVVDTITLNSATQTISGSFTIDSGGDINLDASGTDFNFKVDATTFLVVDKSGNNARLENPISDGDILFRGNDGGSAIQALKLDMSDEGAAIFNKNIAVGGQISLSGGTAQSSDFTTGGIHFHDSSTSTGDVMPISFTPSASGNRARAAIGFISQPSSSVAGFAGAVGIYTRDAADGTAMGTSDERVRIDQSGNTLFGCTALPDTSTHGAAFMASNAQELRLSIAGTGNSTRVRFFNGNGEVGSIRTNGSATAFNTSSDYRLKENVTYDFDATSRLKQLKPCRFNFKADANTTVDGFLAHEVTVVPEAISGEKDAMAVETRYTEDDVETQGDNPTKSVGDIKSYSTTEIIPQGIDQSKLVPLLTKALQEQQATIETLTARITALESA